MSEDTVRVELSWGDDYPVLFVEAEGEPGFLRLNAEIPRRLFDALRAARAAENEAVEAIIAWTNEHQPGALRERP